MTVVKCEEGSASVRVSKMGNIQVLCGRRRRWDSLSWHWFSEGKVTFNGLWRGHYGEAIATTANLADALREVGAANLADALLAGAPPVVQYCND